jgi:hypothetical protein
MARQTITRGLLIKSPHIDRILAGRKTWEIRGSRTSITGPIGLIRSGSGQVVGTCEVVGVVGPLTLAELKRNARKAGFAAIEISRLPYPRTFAWVLTRAKPMKTPRRYTHPSGAIRWVKLRAFNA